MNPIETTLRKIFRKKSPMYPWDRRHISASTRHLIIKLLQQHSKENGQHSYSQSGEDLFLQKVFLEAAQGTIVEIGAHDGITHSNSLLFEESGWQSILIEPDPISALECRKNRPKSKIFETAILPHNSNKQELTFYSVDDKNASTLSWLGDNPSQLKRVQDLGYKVNECKVEQSDFEDIAKSANLNPHFEILSVDCEGMDFDVIQSIDLRKWLPQVIISEDRTTKCRNHLRANGYADFLITGMNMISIAHNGPKKYFNERTYWEANT